MDPWLIWLIVAHPSRSERQQLLVRETIRDLLGAGQLGAKIGHPQALIGLFAAAYPAPAIPRIPQAAVPHPFWCRLTQTRTPGTPDG